MSDDIVERLLWLQNDMMGQHSITAKEAADEIERLRDDRELLLRYVRHVVEHEGVTFTQYSGEHLTIEEREKLQAWFKQEGI